MTGHITTQQSNSLGKPSTASIPKLQKLCHLDPLASSSNHNNLHPLPAQAMALKTYEMAAYGLKRINEKANQVYQLKIVLEIIHILVSSLKPKQIGFALQTLGMFNIDSLFHTLFEECRLHPSTPLSVGRTTNEIVTAIRVVLMEKENELVTNVKMVSDFLILYSSGNYFKVILNVRSFLIVAQFEVCILCNVKKLLAQVLQLHSKNNHFILFNPFPPAAFFESVILCAAVFFESHVTSLTCKYCNVSYYMPHVLQVNHRQGKG